MLSEEIKLTQCINIAKLINCRRGQNNPLWLHFERYVIAQVGENLNQYVTGSIWGPIDLALIGADLHDAIEGELDQ